MKGQYDTTRTGNLHSSSNDSERFNIMSRVLPIKTYPPDDYVNMYLDWVNNFLTVGKFAEYYGISEDYAQQIIKIGRIQHELSIEIAQSAEMITT